MYLDADEVIDHQHYPLIREAMGNAKIDLISFNWVHFYGTASYHLGRSWKSWQEHPAGQAFSRLENG